MLKDYKVRHSQMFPVIENIFSSSSPFATPEHEIYSLICTIKRQLKVRMAKNEAMSYRALIQLQNYQLIDNKSYDTARWRGQV